MRVNVYAEEMTQRVEIVEKVCDGAKFTGLRFYLELPCTDRNGEQHQGPFMHRPGDDDSAAVTFWGKQDLREVLRRALGMLDIYYAEKDVVRAQDALGAAHMRAHSGASGRVNSINPIDVQVRYDVGPFPKTLQDLVREEQQKRPGETEKVDVKGVGILPPIMHAIDRGIRGGQS